jgi:hypothetical protein
MLLVDEPCVVAPAAPHHLLLWPTRTLQDDNFMPTMTVFETCSYYGALTLPRKYSRAARNERILEVLTAMGLSHTMQTLVSSVGPQMISSVTTMAASFAPMERAVGSPPGLPCRPRALGTTIDCCSKQQSLAAFVASMME